LDDHLGATALVDSPALAAFITYSGDGLLQTVDMVEFPATLAEDAAQIVPPGPASAAQSDPAAPVPEPTDDETLRAQTRQWRATYEQTQAAARQALGGLSGISPAQYAAAAAEGDTAAPSPTTPDSSTGDMDISDWLTPPTGITAAPDDSQFLTVQPFRETRTYTLPLQSIYYQPRFQTIYPQAVVAQNVDGRGICAFLPTNASFVLPVAVTTYTSVNTSIQTYRLLERSGSQYSHEVIAHQLITSAPSVTPAPPASPVIGTENVSFCTAGFAIPGGWSCTENGLGCNAFTQGYSVSSLRGFNQQIVSNFTWDAGTAPLVTLDGWVPQAANDQTTVSSSQLYEKVVAWSVQGAFSGQASKTPNVGVSLGGNYGQMEKWSWSQGTSMSLSAWQMISPGPINPAFPARSIFDFRASVSPDNLANVLAFSNPPATSESPLSFSVGPPQGINNLQAQGLTDRNESDWSTKFKGGLLPPTKATLNVDNTFNYGEVYHLYTLAPNLPAGLQAYGALHTYTQPTIPIQLDFGKAIMQIPLSATWEVTASLNSTAIDGFFPVTGTITLNTANSKDTTLYLGAQLQPSGTSFTPTPSVIQGLPIKLVIPAGQTSATFNARAQRVGSAYNVQFYAFQAEGQQAGFPMTIPAQ